MGRKARAGVALLLWWCLLATGGCAPLFFKPVQGHAQTPPQLGMRFEDVYFEGDDGVLLHGWFLPATGEAVATVLFLHGTAENIGTNLDDIAWLPAAGFNVFLFDYRGYGESAGRPTTMRAVYRDIEAAFATLMRRSDIDPERIIVFGQSLGGALAVHAVRKSQYKPQVKAVVLDSAFSSFKAIAREQLNRSWVTWPLSATVGIAIHEDVSSPMQAIAALAPIPVLIVHSREDQIIPLHHAQRLFAAAAEPKTLWIAPRGRHVAVFNQPAWQDRWIDYVRTALGDDPLPARGGTLAARTQPAG